MVEGIRLSCEGKLGAALSHCRAKETSSRRRDSRGERSPWLPLETLDTWHHQCNVRELGQTLGDGEAQGGLVCCQGMGSWRF